MRAVPKKPTLKDLMGKDRLRPTPAAKKALEDAVKPNRRKTQVTAAGLRTHYLHLCHTRVLPLHPKPWELQVSRSATRSTGACSRRRRASAGGVVIDEDGRALVIQRRDNSHWEPPGGILDKPLTA